MRVSMEEVGRIASLSMLELSEEKKKMLQQNLDEILAHAERLNELNTAGVEPTTYILEQRNVMREDVRQHEWTRDQMLRNAPVSEDGCFIVPKAVD